MVSLLVESFFLKGNSELMDLDLTKLDNRLSTPLLLLMRHVTSIQQKLAHLCCHAIVPLSLKYNNTIIWENPVQNSTSFARPISLTRTDEVRDVLKVELEPFFEVIRNDYKSNIMVNDKPVEITCKTECSMVDGKMVSLLQGDSGAFCHLCHVSRSDANDPDLIAEGFEITKDYESCTAAWDKLQSGEIAYQSCERQGQCHENILKANLSCFSLLHFKLRSLDFAQNILYHLSAGQRIWRETGQVQTIVKRQKQACIDHVRTTIGMLMDSPCGSGGNTNTGPLADRYFSPENRQFICELISNEEDRMNYERLLTLVNIMLTVTQSVDGKKNVRVSKVKSLGIELMAHVRTSFLNANGQPWIMITPSIHQICAHSWQFFELNDGSSIAKWSESPLENWNKYLRSFQSGPASRSRQLSIKENIHDIFKRVLIISHPEIASKKPRPSCSVRGEIGHTASSSRLKMMSIETEERATIHSMYY